MSSPASARVVARLRDGSAWNGDPKEYPAALEALVGGEVSLDEAPGLPDGIRAYVEWKHSGVNSLETIPNEALGDTDAAAAERCRRLFIGWAREAGVDRVRWIMKVDGAMEADVTAYAAHEADDLRRMMVLIRHKHRNEPEWNPGTPDEFAGGMLMRQVQDLSMGYRTRGMFGSSWKEYERLSAASQGKFEGHVLRMVTISYARRSAQVAAFNRKFDDRLLPTTKEEADEMMADMISEVIGRRVEPPIGDRPAPEPGPASPDDLHDLAVARRKARMSGRADSAGAGAQPGRPPLQPTVGVDAAYESTVAHTVQDIDPIETTALTYAGVIASVKGGLTGDFKRDGALITSVAQSCGGHPQAKEIRRELGRMLHAIAPDEVKAEFDQIVDGFESGFDDGLAEARALTGARDVATAKEVLEDLVRRYGTGTGLYRDDSVSEYRHFANSFELALYAHIYRPTRHVRKLPQDRATLYSLYGAVLLELRDADGAEEALRESLRVNPVSTYAIFELGEVMKLTGRKRELRELTLRAMEVAYTEAELGRGYRNLGYLAIEDTNYDLAVACYCMSLGIDRDHAQAAQSELFYIQQVTGKTLALPDPATVEATVAKNGVQVGPSQLVTELMDSAAWAAMAVPRAVPGRETPVRAPDLMDQFADRPLPKTREEADALMADVFSAALGRRVERRPAEAVEATRPTRQLLVSADGTAVGFVSIGAALAEAVTGDAILVRPGDYRETLVIDKAVTIRGDGPRDRITVHQQSSDEPAISITANAPRITGLTISGLGLAVNEDKGPVELVRVSGGTPSLLDLDLVGGEVCVAVFGPETAGTIRSCILRGAESAGIAITLGATPLIEENDVWGNARYSMLEAIRQSAQDFALRRSGQPARPANEIWGDAEGGIWISGVGTAPQVRANRIHDGKRVGIFVGGGASAQVEGNEVWANVGPGIVVAELGSDPFVGANRVHDGASAGIYVKDGASPRIEGNEVWGNAGEGIGIDGEGTSPIVRTNRVHDGQGGGIAIEDGASPCIEDNELWGNTGAGIGIIGEGTDPIVRANRIHDGLGSGIAVEDGASPRIEANDIWGNAHPGGIVIDGEGSAPQVSVNRVHDSESYGIVVTDGASPRIEDNEVSGNAMPGIYAAGVATDPVIRGNRVHGGGTCGIGVVDGASPSVEDNEVWGHKMAEFLVTGTGTDPLVSANRVHDSRRVGIDVMAGACPRIQDNEVWGNVLHGISIGGAGTDPVIRGNRIHDGQSAGILVLNGATPLIEANRVWGNPRGAIIIQAATPVSNGNVINEGPPPRAV